MTHATTATDYEVISLDDGSWGVEVSGAGRIPRTETGFDTREEAEAWMYSQLESPPESDELPSHI
jgi:hypothetical protein